MRTITARTSRIGTQTMANQIPASVSACSTLTRLADASSTATLGSQPFWATSTATTGTRKLAVSVAYAERPSRSLSPAVNCSIWPRTLVSWFCTSRTSEILVAVVAISWSDASLARRFLMRASRSTTWPVTSTASVRSATTLVPAPEMPRSTSRASSQRSTGMR